MPLYEYQCQKPDCAAVTEKLRHHSQMDEPCKCKDCGGETKKKISRTSFALKGGGWAADGYGS